MGGGNLIWIFAFAINIIAFIVIGIDKSRAKNHKWRISERTLWAIAIVGGSLGSMLGMFCFRHKTRKLLFKYGFPLLVVIHAWLLQNFIY